jgi:NAD(P)-dependent dehydrogenase (short-subunit alcohol dehydrogenase family)
VSQVVLVTGGSRGVGRGIASCFADAGARVVICGRKEPEKLPDGWEFFAADVREFEQVEALITHIVEQHGRIDVAVNNAGGSPPADSTTASPKFSTSIIALNLLAPLFVAQVANRFMQDQETGGSVINISSVSGMRPSPNTVAYGAAKAGLINMTETLAVEWAPKVRVNCVSAGIVRTEQADLFYGDEAGVARVEETIPMHRMATPEDVGRACVFLASPAASYISGANLAVHGGGEPPVYLTALT